MATTVPIVSSDSVVLKSEPIDDAVSGDNTIVTAVAGKQICVVSIMLISAGDMTVRFEDGAGGTALTGQMTVTGSSGFHAVAQNSGSKLIPHFATSVGTLLNLELSAATSADGWITYFEL